MTHFTLGAFRTDLDEGFDASERGRARADCTFCSIAAGRQPAHKVWEDEHTIAFLDILPLRPGELHVARASIGSLKSASR